MRGNREQDMRYYDLVGNLPWALNNCWSQYRYSMDDGMLRDKIYPLLRRAINLYLHMVSEGITGEIRITGEREHTLRQVTPDIYEIDLKTDEVAVLYGEGR